MERERGLKTTLHADVLARIYCFSRDRTLELYSSCRPQQPPRITFFISHLHVRYTNGTVCTTPRISTFSPHHILHFFPLSRQSWMEQHTKKLLTCSSIAHIAVIGHTATSRIHGGHVQQMIHETVEIVTGLCRTIEYRDAVPLSRPIPACGDVLHHIGLVVDLESRTYVMLWTHHEDIMRGCDAVRKNIMQFAKPLSDSIRPLRLSGILQTCRDDEHEISFFLNA